jgi:hypothetical protein
MRKFLNKPWFVALLALAAIAFVWNSIRPKTLVGVASVASATTAAVEPPAQESATAATSLTFTGGSVDDALKALMASVKPRDPFAVRAKSVAPEPAAEEAKVPDVVDTVRLSAIWIQEGRTYLLINGQIHEVGDELARLRIESATTDGVWLAHWKGRDFLALGADFTLVTPARKATPVASL